MRTFCCACLVVALGAEAAPAVDNPSVLSQQVEAAKALFENGSFAAVINDLQAVVAQPTASRSAALRRSLADAYLYLALSYAALGDSATATDAFANALRLDAGLSIDPEVYAPRVVALFQAARASLEQRASDRRELDAGGLARAGTRGLAAFVEVAGAASARWQLRYPFVDDYVSDALFDYDSEEIHRHVRPRTQPRGSLATLAAGVRIRDRHTLMVRRTRSRNDDQTSFVIPYSVADPPYYRLSETLDIDSTEVVWRAKVLQRGRLRWFTELGGRHSHVSELVELRTGPVSTAAQILPDFHRFALASHTSGPRAGAGLELTLAPRWSVRANAGLARVSGTDSGRESTSAQFATVTSASIMSELTTQLGEAHTASWKWDTSVAGRGQLTRYLYLQLGYTFVDYGPSVVAPRGRKYESGAPSVQQGPRRVLATLGLSLGIELGR